ncbi:geranylgeranyl diphosphate reductase [Pseudahrensia aquimaris]|uniref:geranylgeranyl diphosphate reductase n=1 Tax=Pseudahrensia aquimaris TaxID=744461 RepID=A0ABW3FLV1_9HYPH
MAYTPNSSAPKADFDVIVVGGGPSGATAANDLAAKGHSVLLLDRAGRIKPCGGAIPPRCIEDFEIPDELICARIRSARMISPKNKAVDMPIENGFVGMVNRETFDEWLRERAEKTGAERRVGTFVRLERNEADQPVAVYTDAEGAEARASTKLLIGADGAKSKVLKQGLPNVKPAPYVFAYHEIIKAPKANGEARANYDPTRCDVYYQGRLSPDFYAWVFPHGDTASIGVGSAKKGFSLRGAVADLRRDAGMEESDLVRHEGAPIPMKPIKRWDNGRDVIVTGDAAGVVAPASGEGIYYAMAGGRMVADAVHMTLLTGEAKALATARRTFMKEHGKVFFVLGLLQYFWYGGDRRRERFVKICEDPDVQRLTWESYMNKRLVKREPMAHVRVFFKDLSHLLGLAKT